MTLNLVWNTDIVKHQNKKQKHKEWSLNHFYSNTQKDTPKKLKINSNELYWLESHKALQI